jgi:hypothetical protein
MDVLFLMMYVDFRVRHAELRVEGPEGRGPVRADGGQLFQ